MQLPLEPGYLRYFVDLSNKWCKLSEEINWGELEISLSPFYSKLGRPAKDIRLMCSLLIIKQVQNLSDERTIEEWIHNPYFQYFSGEEFFQWKQPCTPSELTHFRNRIGEDGIKEIFRMSVQVNGLDALETEIIADTTVQEKNITFPTDLKLHIKIITRCLSIANKESIKLRQTYKHTLHTLKRDARFGRGKKQAAKKRKAIKRIKTIAAYLVRELYRKLTNIDRYSAELAQYEQVLSQERGDKHKVYSLHEPEVRCISKGKTHKKYEFGNKVSIAITKTTNVIVSVVSFIENVYDGNTIAKTLSEHKRFTGIKAKKLFYDRGGRGHKEINGTQIIIPDNAKKKRTDYQRRKSIKDFRRRTAIEPIIGHLKQDYRMFKNYLKGTTGDAINAIMAASAFNFKRKMRLFYHFLTVLFNGKYWNIYKI